MCIANKTLDLLWPILLFVQNDYEVLIYDTVLLVLKADYGASESQSRHKACLLH